jgi:hypothetical protein
MPLAQSRRRQPHTGVILPWSNPFFPPQKRRIANFLQTVNVGISSLPPSLFPLGQNDTTDRVWKAIADAGPTPSWYCPAVSPRSAGLLYPVFLYGVKTVELYTDSVFSVGIRSVFLGIYHTDTEGKLGRYISVSKRG